MQMGVLRAQLIGLAGFLFTVALCGSIRVFVATLDVSSGETPTDPI